MRDLKNRIKSTLLLGKRCKRHCKAEVYIWIILSRLGHSSLWTRLSPSIFLCIHKAVFISNDDVMLQTLSLTRCYDYFLRSFIQFAITRKKFFVRLQKYFTETTEAIWTSCFKLRAKIEIKHLFVIIISILQQKSWEKAFNFQHLETSLILIVILISTW